VILKILLKKVDIDFGRTTFVYTKFNSQIQKFSSTKQVNKYLSSVIPDAKSFFVSFFSSKVRAKFGDYDKFQEKVFQAYKRDILSLENLQYDKRFEPSVGVHALRKHVLNLVWKNYQDGVPRILKALRQKRTNTQENLKKIQSQLEGLTSAKLRNIATNYVVDFLQVIETLIAGTSEGNPSVNGQTLSEEITAHGEGSWPIKVDAEKFKISYYDSKLYGGQQFERLLSEFKAVVEHTELTSVTKDSIATAAGINKLNNVPNFAMAASHIAQQKSQDSLAPIIEHLNSRAHYIMGKRLVDIADRVLEQRRRTRFGTNSTVDIENIEQYPHFTYLVKDLYNTFVQATSKTCQTKCLDEFYSTKTVYWELTENPEKGSNFDLENSKEESKEKVEALAIKLFERIRDRIKRNVLLKTYNFFLVPLQTELWNVIQSKVTSLSDAQLEQHFEVGATKTKLTSSIKENEEIIKKTTEQEGQLLDAAALFSHPVIKAN